MKNVLITKADGSSVNASVICYFKVNDARYVYYTLNELSQDPTNQTIKIYVAKEKTDNPAVDVPITEEDWTILKGYMSDVLKDAPLAGVEYLPSKENMIIVDEKGIAMPTSYDYVNKHAKVYQDAVSSSEDAGSANVLTPAAAPAEVSPAPAAAPEAPAPASPVAPEAPAVPEVPAPEAAPAAPQVETPAPEAESVFEKQVPPAPEVTPPAEPEVPSGITLPEVEPTPEGPTTDPFAGITAPEAPAETPLESASADINGERIDIDKIHEKYEEMRKNIDELEAKEKAAAESYNATLDLIKTHNEQHAEKVAESIGEVTPVTLEPTPEASALEAVVPTPEAPAPEAAPAQDITSQVVAQETAPAPSEVTPAVPEAPVAPEAPIAPEVPAAPALEPVAPAVTPEVTAPAAPEAVPAATPEAPVAETPAPEAAPPLAPQAEVPGPSAVNTVVPDASQELNAETNWFDMPENS